MSAPTMTIEHGRLHRYVCPQCHEAGRWLRSDRDVQDKAWAHALVCRDLDWDAVVTYTHTDTGDK